MVELEGCPEREVEGSAADGLERVGEGVEALAAKALGPDYDSRARDKTGEDAAYGAYPVIVDSPLEEESGGDEERDDADAAEELGADAVFQRAVGSGGQRTKSGRGLLWMELGKGVVEGLRVYALSKTGWSAVLPVAALDFRRGRRGLRGSRPAGLARWAASAGPDSARPAHPPKPWQLLYRYRAPEW
ncbi:hypothetical protein RBB80_13365 [Tunturiibacter gelidiferens]